MILIAGLVICSALFGYGGGVVCGQGTGAFGPCPLSMDDHDPRAV